MRASTNRCPQVHQTLRVCLNLVSGQQGFGALPEFPLNLWVARKAVYSVMTRQNAPDVTVQDRRALAEGECRNCGGSRTANAGKLRKPLDVAGECPAVFAFNQLRATMQIARSRVIP